MGPVVLQVQAAALALGVLLLRAFRSK